MKRISINKLKPIVLFDEFERICPKYNKNKCLNKKNHYKGECKKTHFVSYLKEETPTSLLVASKGYDDKEWIELDDKLKDDFMEKIKLLFYLVK